MRCIKFDGMLEWDRMLPVIVSATRAKHATDRHSPYELIIGAYPTRLITLSDNILPPDDSGLEDNSQWKAGKHIVTEVLNTTKINGQFTNKFVFPSNPCKVSNLVLMRKPYHTSC